MYWMWKRYMIINHTHPPVSHCHRKALLCLYFHLHQDNTMSAYNVGHYNKFSTINWNQRQFVLLIHKLSNIREINGNFILLGISELNVFLKYIYCVYLPLLIFCLISKKKHKFYSLQYFLWLLLKCRRKDRLKEKCSIFLICEDVLWHFKIKNSLVLNWTFFIVQSNNKVYKKESRYYTLDFI